MKVSELKNEVLMYRLRDRGIDASWSQATQLRKSAMRLHRWHESMCNDTWIDDDTGIAYRQYGSAYHHPMETVKVPNIGAIEEKKIKAVCSDLNCYYRIQGDPRGASLYVSTEIDGRDLINPVCCEL